MQEHNERTEWSWDGLWLEARARQALVATLLALASGPAAAEDFTFRRVGVPNGNSTDRITVQIGAAASAIVGNSTEMSEVQPVQDEPEPARPAGRATAQTAGVAWFWTGVSPLLSEARPGRLQDAFAVIADAPPGEVMPAQPQALQKLADLYGADILRLTSGTRVSPTLVLAVMAVESAGRSDAVSHAGAAGLMQLMPATAARFGVEDRLDPAESIRGGVAYLDWLLHHFGDDQILALAAYNAGEGSVENNSGVPPYPETRAYVPNVLATWAVARDLCKAPSDPTPDRCGFMVAGL